jgi:hypothetical protein
LIGTLIQCFFLDILIVMINFSIIYAGNYRLRFFIDDIKWLFLTICSYSKLFCEMEKTHWLTGYQIRVGKVNLHPLRYTASNDEAALGSEHFHEHETPICGRPRKPRPLILRKAHHDLEYSSEPMDADQSAKCLQSQET